MNEGDRRLDATKEERRRKRRRSSFVVRWFRRFVTLALIVLILALGLYLTRERTLHPLLARVAPSASRAFSPYEVRFDDLEGDWRHGLAVTGLSIRRLDGSAPLVRATAERAEVRGDLLGLARTRDLALVESVSVVEPDVHIALAGGGGGESDDPGGEPFDLATLPTVALQRGRVLLEAGGPPILIDEIEVHGGGGEPVRATAHADAKTWAARASASARPLEGGGVRFSLNLGDAVARGISVRVDGLVGSWTPERLELTRGEIGVGPNSALIGGITVSSATDEPVIEGAVELDLADIGAVQSVLVGLGLLPPAEPWTGSAHGDLALRPAPGRFATGTVDLVGDDIALYGVRLGHVEVALEQASGALRVDATGVETPAQVVGVIPRVNIVGTLEDTRVRIADLDAETMYGALRSQLDVEFDSAGAALALETFSIAKGDALLELETPSRVEFTGEGVRIDDLRLTGTAGRLELHLGPRAEGGLSGALDARRLDLTPFVPVLDASLEQAAVQIASIDGHVDFTEAPFDLGGNLVVRAIVRRAGTLEEVVATVAGRWTAGAAEVDSLTVDALGARLTASGSMPLAADLTPDATRELALTGNLTTGTRAATNPIVAELVGAEVAQALARVEGEATLSFALGGTWAHVTGTLELEGEGLRLAGEPTTALPYLDTPANVNVTVQLEKSVKITGGRIAFGDKLGATIDAEIARALDLRALVASGDESLRWTEAPVNGNVSLDTRSLDELASLVEELRETGGDLEANLQVIGTVGAPRITGTVSLVNGTARYRGAPPITNANITLDFQRAQVQIVTASMDVGSAPVVVTGNMLLGQNDPRIDGTIKGKNVLLVRSSEARLRADLDLVVGGRLGAATVGGEITIVDGRVRSPIQFQSLLEGGGAAPPSIGRGLRLPALGPPTVALDARIRTAEPIRLEGRIARGGLRTELQLVGTAAEPRTIGNVFFDPLELAVPAGTIEFPSGVVTFDPNSPEIPRLDIIGETRLAGYDVTVSVEGEYDRAEVELSSSPPLPPDDLLLLVLTGQPPRAGAGLGAAGQSVALYVAKDLVRGWFASGGFDEDDRESFLDRLEVVTGRDVSRSGVLTIEASYKLREGLARKKDALYLVLERDAFEDYGLGLRLVLRLD